MSTQRSRAVTDETEAAPHKAAKPTHKPYVIEEWLRKDAPFYRVFEQLGSTMHCRRYATKEARGEALSRLRRKDKDLFEYVPRDKI